MAACYFLDSVLKLFSLLCVLPTVEDSIISDKSKKSNSIKSSVHKQTSVSAFGSVTAHFNDGMTLALSQFGNSGEALDGKLHVVIQLKL